MKPTTLLDVFPDDLPEIRIKKLKEEIEKHNTNYYLHNDPSISDEDYDALIKVLENLEKNYPEFATSDSPTQHVGGGIQKGFKSAQHYTRMQSIANAFDDADVNEFQNRITKDLHKKNIDLSAEPKFDGLAISLVYEKGHLVRAATRGDGEMGEDVTEQVKTIQNIPHNIVEKCKEQLIAVPDLLEVRGEIVMLKKDFETINKNLRKNGEKPLSNPRNAASGALRQLDPKVTASRPLHFFMYAIGITDGFNKKDNHMETLLSLEKLGFPLAKFNHKYLLQKMLNVNECLNYYNYIGKIRDDLPFDIDGVVYKVNNYDEQNLLGFRSKTPIWALAHKFPPQERTTKLLAIENQVGRTGAITPVGRLEPINVGGVVITNATLHNFDEISRKDIRVGDLVVIRRAGDVIPEIVKSVTQHRSPNTSPVLVPSCCPVCGSVAVKSENEAVIRCTGGKTCKAQIKGALELFVSRKAMNIEGIGETLISQAVDKGLLSSLEDIYALTEEKLCSLDRMGQKLAQKILTEIQQSKTPSLAKFLFALGIRYVGESTAKSLAKKYETLDLIQKATYADFLKIDDIGESVATSLVEWFKDEKNLHMLEKFNERGIKIKKTEKTISENMSSQIFQDKIFVLTGTLPHLTREKATDIIESLGGKVSSSISKKVFKVLAGNDAGSKLKKAQEIGVDIWDEDTFLNQIPSSLSLEKKDSSPVLKLKM